MTDIKTFFHDRFVLFLLTTNAFLVAVCAANVLLRLGDTNESYIQFYRSNLGLNSFSVGGVSELVSFPIFAGLLFFGHIWLGLRFYAVRKHAGWITLMLTTLLLLFCVIVSNALLQLR